MTNMCRSKGLLTFKEIDMSDNNYFDNGRADDGLDLEGNPLMSDEEYERIKKEYFEACEGKGYISKD